MGTAKLTEALECVWPARFGPWAERAPDSKTLCRTVREVSWRLRPPTVEDVKEVISEAARNRTPLWPVSIGRNWGYGSHLPARDGSVILDLGKLDAIGDLDRPSLSVRIEPGVTQAAMQEFLRAKAPDLALNVTGSGRSTSVLGNALDRGIGYSGEKDQDVYALEVIFADGSSSGPVDGLHHKARTHPAGLSTDALFFQSNFGVVVGARLRLRVRQEAEFAVVLQGPFPAVITTLKRAYDECLVSKPTHVAEPGRTHRLGFGLLRTLWRRDPTAEEVSRCFPEQNSFNGLVPVYGRRSVVDAAWSELKRIAPNGVKLSRADAGRLEFAATWLDRFGARFKAARLRALRPLIALIWGEPSDAGLASLDGFKGGDPDLAGRGAIYGNAVTAVDSRDAERVMAIVRRKWKDSAFTWIILDGRCMITIYTVHFDEAAAQEAREANSQAIRELRSAGYPTYRLDIGNAAAAGAENVVGRIKAAFDPLGIIAPGRYEP
jgi:4-cresol dehydrogenase (hydroxylating) flavoprotein subunit